MKSNTLATGYLRTRDRSPRRTPGSAERARAKSPAWSRAPPRGGYPGRMRAPERRRRQYYVAAATFWLGAMHLQRVRCTVPRGKGLLGPEVDAHRADMDFFVVSVKRLRAVAC